MAYLDLECVLHDVNCFCNFCVTLLGNRVCFSEEWSVSCTVSSHITLQDCSTKVRNQTAPTIPNLCMSLRSVRHQTLRPLQEEQMQSSGLLWGVSHLQESEYVCQTRRSWGSRICASIYLYLYIRIYIYISKSCSSRSCLSSVSSITTAAELNWADSLLHGWVRVFRFPPNPPMWVAWNLQCYAMLQYAAISRAVSNASSLVYPGLSTPISGRHSSGTVVWQDCGVLRLLRNL